METEKEIFQYIRAGKLVLPPLSFKPLSYPKKNDIEAGMLLETNRQNKQYKFVAEVKRYSSDKTILQAIDQVRHYAQKLKANPLVIVPWLSDNQLISLEKQGISGLDLCGNGVITIPGQLFVFRSGQPNKFPTSRPIRKVYEGTSSLVARVFLLKPEYDSVVQILNEITRRGGNITLPTVSKALRQLEEDVIIWRDKNEIKVVQPDKLLDRLKENYEPPRISESMRCKLTIEKNEKIGAILSEIAKKVGIKLVLSGESSVNYYATMAKEPLDSFYCTQFPIAQLKKLGANIDTYSRFPNLELKQTDIEPVYFDLRNQAGCNIASPIQTYLELATSDKRGQETAQQVRQQILDNITKEKKRS